LLAPVDPARLQHAGVVRDAARGATTHSAFRHSSTIANPSRGSRFRRPCMSGSSRDEDGNVCPSTT
jgi:hypothetical protein